MTHSPGMAADIYLRAPGDRRRSPGCLGAVIHLDEPEAAGFPLHHNLGELLAPPVAAAPEAQSFLLAALGVWAADKLLPRSSAPDAWTRQIVLHLPGSHRWNRSAPQLANLLNFLTGDVWTLKMREVSPHLNLLGSRPPSWQPDAVMLFSGGLDSLVGAIDALETGQRLVLVSHYDFGQLASVQQQLAAALAGHYGPERVRHVGLRVQFPEAPELTLRSRSLLFLALGLLTAAGLGATLPVLIPENGWISLNPPLTPGRLGSYSTRTTHPHFLSGLAALWQAAGFSHPLVNPYRLRTKGDLVRGCRHRELLQQLYARSLSCSRPVVSRWRRQPAGACGYCYPCLMRRAALHSLGWDDGGDYLLDVLAAPETLRHRIRGRDLRALLLALRTWEETPEEVAARLWPAAPSEDLAALSGQAREVLPRGFGELGRFFREKGPQWVRAYAGW
jgi:7-cyano-7-deazaguanine synthase in queuosine biosynthesis